jgi:AraC family transcriptional regulator
MLNEALCGDRLAAFFPMVDRKHVKSISSGAFAATRLSYESASSTKSEPSPPDDAFGLCLSLRRLRTELSLDGHWSESSTSKDEAKILDFQSEIILRFHDSFDFLFFYMPRHALREVAELQGIRSLDFNVALGKSITDPVIAHLGASLLPTLDNPQEACDLFVSYVAMALQMHFVQNYLGGSQGVRPRRSGLTARQLRIAKHMMQQNLAANVPLQDIAQACGLSRSHFARAFAISAGQPPHQWLLEQRIGLACQLLSDGERSIGEVAIRCGFADQSHFTRVFSAKVGQSPARWRRTRRR